MSAVAALSLLGGSCSSSGDVLPVPEIDTTTSQSAEGSTDTPTDAAAEDATGSSAGSEQDVSGGAEDEADGAAEPTTSTSATTPGPPVSLAGDGAGFKELAPSLERIGIGVVSFADALTEDRIEELAAGACAGVRPDMTDSQLGSAGLAAYDGLTAEEQQIIVEADWVVFYGALVGFFCPDRLPLGSLEDAPPTEGTAIEQFREVIIGLDGVSGEAEAFTAGLADEQLEELRDAACSTATRDMTTEDFGLIIVSSYDEDLSDADRQVVSLSAYGQFYGAVVGWFCPENLPL